MKYAIIIEHGAHNDCAYIPDLPGCITTGKNRDQTINNIREAIEGHLEMMILDGNEIPPQRPDSATRKIAAMEESARANCEAVVVEITGLAEIRRRTARNTS